MNDKSISPASIPSLAESSCASSSPESEDIRTVTRTLFSDKASTVRVAKDVVENIEEIADRDCQFECGVSTTSSDMTVVANRNLSAKTYISETEETYLPSILNGRNDEDDGNDDGVGLFPAKEYSRGLTPNRLVFEDPPEATTACNNPLSLTPKQLADIFLAFEGAQRIWPPKASRSEEEELGSTDSATKSPTRSDGWTQRAESLERECISLKKIIRDDSSKLLNLRSALEAQRELNSMKHVELAEKSVELQIAEERVLALRREKEEFRERESELVETINILKSEVDTLTRFKSTIEASKEEDDEDQSLASQLMEMEQMKSKIEFSSMRISEQETIITELRRSVESKEAENCQLQKDLVTLQEKRDIEDSVCLGQLCGDGTVSHGLAVMLVDISTRLTAVEKAKDETEKMLLRELKEKTDEIKALTEKDRKSTTETNKTDNRINIYEDPDEIEVIPPKMAPTAPDVCCCVPDVWTTTPGDKE